MANAPLPSITAVVVRKSVPAAVARHITLPADWSVINTTPRFQGVVHCSGEHLNPVTGSCDADHGFGDDLEFFSADLMTCCRRVYKAIVIFRKGVLPRQGHKREGKHSQAKGRPSLKIFKVRIKVARPRRDLIP